MNYDYKNDVQNVHTSFYAIKVILTFMYVFTCMELHANFDISYQKGLLPFAYVMYQLLHNIMNVTLSFKNIFVIIQDSGCNCIIIY